MPLHDCNEEDFDQFYPVEEKYSETLELLKNGKNSLQCIDFTDTKVALSTIQNIDFIFITCDQLPDFLGIDKGPDWWTPRPEYLAYVEKECGKIPDGEYFMTYYYSKYLEYMY